MRATGTDDDDNGTFTNDQVWWWRVKCSCAYECLRGVKCAEGVSYGRGWAILLLLGTVNTSWHPVVTRQILQTKQPGFSSKREGLRH